ncbi:MAG: 50S ribosomal protein L6 [Actinomycetes bacterium]|jgi:large subunit ribosomal protein L6|nr:50S ribosomal protein L6 [Actinomycetes bacterium]
MSRIGKMPIPLPAGVEVDVEGNVVTIKGKLGQLSQSFQPEVAVARVGDEVIVTRVDDSRVARSFHGLTRTLISNMIVGVSEGYSRNLEIVGVGYRATLKGKDIELALGYSHPVIVTPEEGIEFEVPQPTRITVKGIDKQRVGQVAADIRPWRKPEPYKGKGIRYEGEHVRRKMGKAAG